MTGVTGVTEEIIDVETADGPMAVLSKQPIEGSDRLVVVFHDGPGIRDATHDFTRKLATDGYRVVIPDLYHRHGRLIGFTPEQTKADRSLVDRIWEMIRSLSDNGIQSDLDATLGALHGVPDRFAVLGFCLGARAVCRTMMRLPERAVVGAAWHPSFLVDDHPDSPHLSADALPGTLYLGFGAADSIMTLESMQPFIDAVARRSGKTVIDVHADAEHGFTWPGSPNYDEAAAARSYEQTTALFRENC